MTDPARPVMDQTATLVMHAAEWSNDSVRNDFPAAAFSACHCEGASPSEGVAPLDPDTRRISLRAARYAAAAYPGALGELISREIRTYVAADEQVPRHALSRRLIVAMQNREASTPLSPVPNAAPRYVPGTPLHFRSPTVADEPFPREETSIRRVE